MVFKEELLQFIWQYKLFTHTNLKTVRGESIEILDNGKLNVHSGADFSNAKIRLGNTILVGNIELHIRERDWLAHKHDRDKAYQNIILHVVYEADKSVDRHFETLELKPLIDQSLLHTYQMLFDNQVKIPCYYIFKKPEPFVLQAWLYRLSIERLEQKIYAINELFLQCNSDWNKTMAVLIAGYLGANLNRDAMMQLLMSFDFKILAKYCKNIFRTEALLFGQAGLLQEIDNVDPYYLELRHEYKHLQALYQLKPIQATAFKFSRLRPLAFPTLRIAQLAQILFVHGNLFDTLIKQFQIKAMQEMLNLEASSYWLNHYHFGYPKEKSMPKSLGSQGIEIILINAIVPLLFYYGKEIDNDRYCQQAIQLLESRKAEKNHITKLWESLEIGAKHAFESQALIQLKNNYCDKHQCLKCSIGLYLMKPAQAPK